MKYLIYRDKDGVPTGFQSFEDDDDEGKIMEVCATSPQDTIEKDMPEELKETPGHPVRLTEGEYISEMIREKYTQDDEIAIMKDAMNAMREGKPVPKEYEKMEALRAEAKSIAAKESRLREKK
jgi:hypothetical protein